MFTAILSGTGGRVLLPEACSGVQTEDRESFQFLDQNGRVVAVFRAQDLVAFSADGKRLAAIADRDSSSSESKPSPEELFHRYALLREMYLRLEAEFYDSLVEVTKNRESEALPHLRGLRGELDRAHINSLAPALNELEQSLDSNASETPTSI